MKKILLFILLICSTVAGKSQTWLFGYFGTTSSAFISIAGSPLATEVTAIETDDETAMGIPIGFTFNFCGVPYSTVSACSNGWISLSMTPATYCVEWLNSATTIDDGNATAGTLPGTGAGWLMPYWDDLDGSSGHAYYATTGSFPNRVFIFEWNNWAATSPGTGHLSFQVKLLESTNQIIFNYGPPSTFSGCSATIGIANHNLLEDWDTMYGVGPGDGPELSPFYDHLAASPSPNCLLEWTPFPCTMLPVTGVLTTCTGGTTTLADATTGGTWVSSNTAVATVNATTGVVTGVTAGTATISYMTTVLCYATAVVSVSALPPIVGSLELCQGATGTISSAAPDGVWSTGITGIADITSSGTVNGLLAGATPVTYTTPDGCFTTAELTIDPTPAPITGSLTACTGITVPLGSSPAGSTWSSSVAATATIDPISGLVSTIAPGTTTIAYTNSFGCAQTAVMTVIATVPSITGAGITCVGSTTLLNNTVSGGVWSSSGNASADPVSGVITGMASGTATVTYSFGGACFSTKEVTINAAPSAILGAYVLCPTFTANLTNSVGGGTWSSSNSNISVDLTSGIATGNTGGTAIVTYTYPASSGSCMVTTVMTVNPNPNPITGTLTTCEGLTTTLSTTTPFVTWSSSNTAIATVGSSSGIITGVVAGTASITTSKGGCSINVIVTVNPLPAAIGGTLTVCSGSTTILSDVTTGGTWTSNNIPVAFISGPGPGVIGGSNAGTATISYTLTTGCYRTAIVSVNPLPSAISGNSSICVGNTTTLTSSAGGTWSSSIPAFGTVSSSGVVTGIAAGITTISYILSATGCYRTKMETINPSPEPILGSTVLCSATTTILSDASAGGTWSSLSPLVASVTSTGLVTGGSAGIATINYTVATGCIAAIIMTVNEAPSAIITPLGDTALCPGDFVELTGTATAGATYQWYESASAIPGATSSTYLTYMPGSYQVQETIATGCSAMSVPMSVSVVPATASISAPAGTSGCSGTGVLLDGTATPGFNYQWTLGSVPIAGATNASYVVTTSGDYVLVISNSTGCSATSLPEAVTINPSPSGVVTLSGPLAVCLGNTVTMMADPGCTYQWHNASGSIAGATSVSYTTGIAGSYWVVATNASGCSATSVTSNVVVNPLPDATVSHPGGNTVFCAGGSVHLFAVPGPGFAYQWYNGVTAITGATNDNYTASVAGSYKVRVTDPATGCTNITSAGTAVTVISSPTVIPLTPARFCWGGNSILSTSVSSAGSAVEYQWFLNTVAIPAATNSTYSATVPGLYSCSISVPASCIATTSAIPVYENPLPDPIVTYDGTMFHVQSYYVTYQWYKGSVMIPGATTSSTPAISNGSYKVNVTDTNGCQSMSTFYVLTNWNGHSTEVTTANKSNVKVYPNPANMLVHVESDVQVHVVITGLEGKQLITTELVKDIDISKLVNGAYLVIVYNNDNEIIKVDRLLKFSE